MRVVPAPWPNVLILEADAREIDAALVRGEARNFLASEEIAEMEKMAPGKRRREWLLGRLAAKQLAVSCDSGLEPRECVVARGKLVARDGSAIRHLSISHSGPYAAAAVADRPIGIDVQVVRDVSERAAHLFLSEKEEESMRGCAIAHRMLHFWCAKEAAWKALGGEVPTLRRVAMRIVEKRPLGLVFDVAETRADGDFIVAVTSPTS